MITHFKIYGERCSGTNYLEKLLLLNFEIESINKYGNIHFFKFQEFDSCETNVLFIGIIRNAHDWINSLWSCKFHVPLEYKNDLHKFLNNEFYSIQEKNNNKEIVEDRNIFKKNQRYKNIFELRSLKIKFLLEYLPKFVSNFILIKYEDLINNFDNTMRNIQQKYKLKIISNNFPENFYKYKNTNHLYVPQDKHNYEISMDDILNNKQFDNELEKKLNYF